MELQPGERVGRYTVDARIGRGGMADVYRATAPDGRVVALKLLGPERRAESPGLLDRLLREASVLEALAGTPGVVGFVERFEDAARRVDGLALEYVDGRALTTAIGDRAVPVARIVEWMGHACHALNDVHAAGFVHRDVKPDNLLLVPDGDPPLRLIDFNSAGPAATGRLTRAQGAFPNTPAYLAPECFDGFPPDASADVYALGITFAEVLAGRHPLLEAGEPEPATNGAWQAVHEERPFPSRLRDDVPPAFHAVLARATAKERVARIPDAVALWGELKAVWDSLAASPPPVAPDPPARPARTGRALFAVLALVGLAALGLFGGVLAVGAQIWADAQRERAEALERAAELERAVRSVPPSVGVLVPPSPSPDSPTSIYDGLTFTPPPEPAPRLERLSALLAAAERGRAEERATALGVPPIRLAFRHAPTLEKLRDAHRFGTPPLASFGVNLPPKGTATLEEIDGVLFFTGEDPGEGGYGPRAEGVIAALGVDTFVLRGVIGFGSSVCRVEGEHAFSAVGHPAFFTATVPCGLGPRRVDLYVDERPVGPGPVPGPVPAPWSDD